MRTKNQTFKWLAILIVVLASTMGAWAQTDDSPTQEVCPGNEPYKIIPGNKVNIFQWSILSGVSGTDWTIESPADTVTNILWANPLTPQTYTVTFKEIDPITLCFDEVSLEVTVNPAPVPVISGNLAVCLNDSDVIYSTPNIVGNTYEWVVTGGTVTAGAGTSEITVTWDVLGEGSVQVTETVTATGCKTTELIPVQVNPTPAPLITGLVTVFQNDSGIKYTTPNVDGNTYEWVVTGGTITAGAGTNEITVTWDVVGEGTVEVTETVTATGCKTTVSIPVQVNPATTTIIGLATVCQNDKGVVYSVPNVGGNTYTWVVTGGTITDGDGTSKITVTWDTVGTGTVQVTETDSSSNPVATTSIEVKVNALPTTSPIFHN